MGKGVSHILSMFQRQLQILPADTALPEVNAASAGSSTT